MINGVSDCDGDDNFLTAGLQVRLAENQRLEALGRLASGAAHDLNNVLSVVVNYAAVISAQLGAEHPLYREVQEIAKAGERAAAIVHQLQLFAGRDAVRLGYVDAGGLLGELLGSLRKRIPENVVVREELADRLPPAWADSGELGQALMHVLLNAVEALAGRGGRLTVRSGLVTLAAGQAPGSLFPGSHVMIEIVDDGPGMDPDVRVRAFDPFFSTKGEGRGLGLSTARGAMATIGGHVELDSAPGRGTRVRLLLPTEALPSTAPAAAARPQPAPQTQTRARIVVCEDEPALRELIRRVLERAGYAVTLTGSADEAEQAVHAAATDLVITDVRLPGRGGPSLAAALKQSHPGLPVLYITGFADVADPSATVLRKPFTPTALAEQVARMLTA